MNATRRLLLAMLVAVLAVGAYLTWKIIGEPTDAPMSLTHDRPECGHAWADSVKVQQINDIIDVPEFHDCQRFVVKDGATYKYDKMFAVFVSETIGALEARLGTVPTVPASSAGTTTSGGVPTTPGSTPLLIPIGNVLAAMVAVVYAEGPYSALGIEAGLNCLYVWRFISDPEQQTTWSARMVPKGAALSCPDASVGTIGTGKDLKVSRNQVAGFTNVTDYPPVTRWDWDDVHAKQYVGIACGAAWCEIYDDQLTPSAPLPVDANDPIDVRRVRLIKGWYDQQFIAAFDAAGNPVPTRVLGTIVPDPKLGAHTDGTFENKWVDVAYISLTTASTSETGVLKHYRDKFNFVETAITNPVTLSIKWKPGQSLWKARIKRPGLLGGFTLKYKNVMRRDGGHTPPAVARWRWMTTDEGTWVRCTAGCCEMSDY